MNDNPVVLSETYILLNISENTAIGTELTRINATDKDIGLNGKVKKRSRIFSICFFFLDRFIIRLVMVFHHQVGWIIFVLMIQLECKKRISKKDFYSFLLFSLTLVGPLDYESEQSYRLTIQVRDLGENSLARFVTIDILILDENDNQPQAFLTFVQPLINDSIISIHENTPIGQILAYVSISDQDSGLNGEMSYKIEQGNNLIGIRTIDQKSFLLIIEHLIDRENFDINQTKKFILIIYDHGKPSKQIRLEYNIIIIDENDSPPVFNQTINCNIQINHSDNQSLG